MPLRLYTEIIFKFVFEFRLNANLYVYKYNILNIVLMLYINPICQKALRNNQCFLIYLRKNIIKILNLTFVYSLHIYAMCTLHIEEILNLYYPTTQ